jgi:peptidoglycan/xylan/chitin deacetylase (PgdA/CDA1 family)
MDRTLEGYARSQRIFLTPVATACANARTTTDVTTNHHMPNLHANSANPWRPAPLVRASMLLHFVILVAWLVYPASWRWLLGIIAGNHLLLFAAVFWPRGSILGANLVRLPQAAMRRGEVSLTFDDGPHPEITPRVLEILDRYRAKASFFCVGERASAFPDIVREIARRGHSVENHSHCHSNAFAFYGMSRLRNEVQAAQEAIARITGGYPVFFRAPVGLRSPLLDPVLARCGLQYVSWTKRGFDAVDDDAASVLRRLTRRLAAGDILVLHDTASSRAAPGDAVVLAVLPVLLERLAASGLKSVPLPAACGLDLQPGALPACNLLPSATVRS